MIMPIDDGSETTNDRHVIAIGQRQQKWRLLWWSNSPSPGGFSQDTWKSRLLLSPGSSKSGRKEPGFHRKNNCQLKDTIIGIYHLDAGASVSFKLPVMERAPYAIPTNLKMSLHPFFRFFFTNHESFCTLGTWFCLPSQTAIFLFNMSTIDCDWNERQISKITIFFFHSAMDHKEQLTPPPTIFQTFCTY